MSAHGCIGNPCVICSPRPGAAPFTISAAPLDTAIRALFALGAKAVVFDPIAGNTILAYAPLPGGDGIGAYAPTADECVAELARKLVARRASNARIADVIESAGVATAALVADIEAARARTLAACAIAIAPDSLEGSAPDAA